MEKNKKLQGIKDIIETAELLLASRGKYQKTINLIFESALRISDAHRACLIIKNKKGELIIKKGVPQYAHGIGQKITPNTGETFLKQVMSDESIVLVTNPCEDSRVAYMREMVMTYGISSMLFLPLFFKNESIGILVFDLVNRENLSKETFENIKLLGRLASIAIGMEYKGQKDQEKILQDEKMRTLGESSSQVAHTIRNSLTIIGGFSGRLLKRLLKESKYGEPKFDSELVETLWGSAKIIDDESKKLERIINDVLIFTSFKKPVLKPHSINKFIKEEISRVSNGVKPGFNLDKQLNRVNTAFDKDMISICMQDLMRNAAEASASRILVKTKLKPKQREIVISVINNGKGISPQLIKDIFSPFMTTKMDGTGLGLANVQSIVGSHGGNISVSSDDDATEFKIILPLLKPTYK